MNALVLVTAAVGIALFLAILAAVDALFLVQPFPGAERVARLDRAIPDPRLLDLEEIAAARADTGLPIAAMWDALPLGRSPGAPLASWVSTNFFDVMGVPPLVGRTFAPGDRGLTDRAVIGERLWRSRYGADSSIVGRSVVIGNERLTVLGVVPATFGVPLRAAVWRPRPARLTYFHALVRLPIGMSAADLSRRWSEWRAVPIREFLAPRDASYAWVLLATAGLLLAAAGVYFLLVHVGETSRRMNEIGVRLALGAGRWQAIRPVVVEASFRTVLCVAAGLLLAPTVLAWLVTRLPADIVSGRIIAMNARTAVTVVALLCAAVAILTALTIRSRVLAPNARDDDRIVRGGAFWGRVMAAAQFAVVAPMLYLLGLSAHGFHALAGRDLGYRTDDILSAHVPTWSGESTVEEAARHLARLQPLLDRVAALPGVEEVALSADRLGFVPTGDRIRVRLAGTSATDMVRAQRSIVTGAYFRLLGIQRVAGDVFDDRVTTQPDWQDIYGGVVVDTTLAAMLGRGADVIGRRVVVGFSPTRIIGVVEPIRARRPDEPVEPRIYLRLGPTAPFASNLLVRFAGTPGPVVQAVASAVQDQMRTAAPADTVLLADELTRLQSPYRGMYELAMLMASVAAVLCLSGMFAAATYMLVRRRKETAVRIALGASGGSILRLCLGEMAWAMPLGTACGLGLGVLLGRQIESRLYGVDPIDPMALVASALLMVGILLLATALPVRYLLRSNVVDALRGE